MKALSVHESRKYIFSDHLTQRDEVGDRTWSQRTARREPLEIHRYLGPPLEIAQDLKMDSKNFNI